MCDGHEYMGRKEEVNKSSQPFQQTEYFNFIQNPLTECLLFTKHQAYRELRD